MGEGFRHTVLAMPDGVAKRAAQAVSYTISGVKPDTWMGPLQPLPPLAPASVKSRAFDYLFGWNLSYMPRSGEEIDFATLKNFAENCPILRLVIETRKDQMCALDWMIRPKMDKNKGKGGTSAARNKYQGRVDEIRDFFKSPDKRLDWHQWLREILEQHFVYDAVSIYRRKDRGGKPYALELIDGATIKVLIDQYGRTQIGRAHV